MVRWRDVRSSKLLRRRLARGTALIGALASGLMYVGACSTDLDYLSAGNGPDGGEGEGGARGDGPAPDATCGDTASNPDHCGRCGHSCKGAACSASLCVPTVIASDVPTPQRLVVHDGVVYWSSKNDIRFASGDGKNQGVVATGQANPLGVAHAPGALVWTNWFDTTRAIVTAPLDGGLLTVLADDQSGADTLMRGADGSLYWTVNPLGPEHFVRGSLADGGKVHTYASNDAGVSYRGPVAAAGTLYWVEDILVGRVMRAGLGGTSATALATGQGSPRSIAADETNVYWTTTNPSGAIVRAAHDGGTPEVLARSLPQLGQLVVDESTIYVLDVDGGRVLSVDKATGTVAVLAVDQERPNDIVVDEAFVYWIVRGESDDDGAILKVAK